MTKKIVFTGGGTGGHIFPIIAIKREFQVNKQSYLYYYLGPVNDKYKILLQQEGFIVIPILSGKLRRYFNVWAVTQNIIDILKLCYGIIQSLIWLRKIQPHLIFSKGGYGAVPVIVSSRILKIPLFIHESDAVASLTTKISQKFASVVFISFPKTKNIKVESSKLIHSGNPIRKELLEGTKEKAIKLFNLTQEKPIILILGGSQGAQRINKTIIQCIKDLLSITEIIHQVGTNNFQEIKKIYLRLPRHLQKYYHFYEFLSETQLKHAFRIANCIISRAGSGAIFEIAANNKASILIPLPESAQNHQKENAYQYAQYGGAIVIEQKNFKPNLLIKILKDLLSSQNKIKLMEEAAKSFAKPNATKIIANKIIDFLENETIEPSKSQS